MGARKRARTRRTGAVRLFGAPEPEQFTSTPEGKVLADTAALHFKSKRDKRISRLLALEKVVLDIFQDRDAARAFALNPEEYVKRYGFESVKMDLNSQEVRIAMAIGDPLARQAAAKGDVDGFVDAILAQGVKPSSGIGRFVHVEALVHSSVVVYFIAAVVTYQKIITATAIPIAVIGAPLIDKAQHVKVLIQLAKHIGNEAFSKQMASRKVEDIIGKYTELVKRQLKTGGAE